ncbi:DUF4192 domain-containing protein [Streptomyces chattanoogensis]
MNPHSENAHSESPHSENRHSKNRHRKNPHSESPRSEPTDPNASDDSSHTADNSSRAARPSEPATPARPAALPAPAASSTPSDAAEDPPAEPQVTLRSAAEIADALPYLMGFYPDDSIVLVALHGDRGRFGGRVRLGIPADTAHWPDAADQLADCLITAAAARGEHPMGILVFLCQEPGAGESGTDVKDRLRPLAQRLRTACGALDVPVLEALCLSNSRFWSYCCPDFRCCPADGTPMAMPGTSVMAAAAAYAGMQVRGSLKEMEARLAPRTGPRAAEQETALDAEAAALVPRMLRPDGAAAVRRDTLELAEAMIRRFRLDTPTGSNRARDACDDALITDAEAASLIHGLQDRITRDRAAEWMEGPAAAPALRLWRALARRCAGGYLEHAVALLTLAGWVCWATDDGPSARVTLGRALSIDPGYVFADLLHRAVNEGLDPEPLRRCLREQRKEREEHDAAARREATAPAKESPRPGKRPQPVRPRAAADRPLGPRGGSRPGGRTTDGRGRRRAGRDGDRGRR